MGGSATRSSNALNSVKIPSDSSLAMPRDINSIAYLPCSRTTYASYNIIALR